MVNVVTLVGRLTRNPELKKTNTGKSVLNFTLAVQKEYNRDQADFINCVVWEKSAEFINNYLGKGSLISVVGSLRSRTYDDSKGNKVFVQEVVAQRVQSLESKSDKEQNNQSQPNAQYNETETVQEEPTLDITSDDLPF